MDNNQTFLNACRNGQKSIVQIFLKKGGIDINKRDQEGNTALYYACQKGYRDIVALLLDNDADASCINNRSESPLHAAARSGNKEILGKLLQKGADINVTDNEGQTPLICLLDNKRTDAALFLMASHPALFQKMDRYLCPEGIDFTKMMRKEEFEYDWMKITADAARNLFSWNSKCAATPFEISRMPAPAIRALFTACFIANGDYMVSVRKNDKGEKVFEIDDSAGKRREAFNLQMEQMMEAPGMEPD